jgi:flagellar export protein FliJ
VRTFTFRAQPALDLRARELEAAQRELARAEELRTIAARRLAEAEERAASARQQAAAVHQKGIDIPQLDRYRFWIIRLDHERAAQAAALTRCEESVAKAMAAVMRAQQRHESLDRFKRKALAAHTAAEHAAETKVIDELATRQFVRRHSGRG